MELKDLEYFLAIAREESITGASRALHLSQPALTRQLKLLEEELGTQLVIRGSRRIRLTEDGMLLRRRAQEILRLTERTCKEIKNSGDSLSGDIYICAGETRGLRFLTAAARHLREQHPELRFHISSGDSNDVVEELEKGLVDFGLLFDPIDRTKYNAVPLPYEDSWGVLMRKDSELAAKASIQAEDLPGKPLIVPRRGDGLYSAESLLGRDLTELEIAGTYSLLFNASLMVADGIGYALCLDRILNLSGESELCFRPFSPARKASMNVVWKRYQVMSRAAETFLAELNQVAAAELES